MNKAETPKIELHPLLKTARVHFRDFAKQLEGELNLHHNQNVLLDCAGIEFVSRSFANALVFSLRNRRITYRLVNAAPVVRIVFQAAEATPERHAISITASAHRTKVINLTAALANGA